LKKHHRQSPENTKAQPHKDTVRLFDQYLFQIFTAHIVQVAHLFIWAMDDMDDEMRVAV
jgi:hypothetical protein